MDGKFDIYDRTAVIFFLEKTFSVHLTQVDNRPTYQKDQTGVQYVIFGGRGTWHGIPDDLLEDIETSQQSAFIIIAIKSDDTMRVFHDSMDGFLSHVHGLKRLGDDKYEFNVSDRGDHLSIDKMSTETLNFLGEFGHTELDRARMKKIKMARDIFNRLSEREREELLAKLH